MTDGSIRELRHEAIDEVASSKKIDPSVVSAVRSALAGRPGFSAKEQKAGLNAALDALDGVEGNKAARAREALEEAKGIVKARKSGE